jgi:Ca2+/Na+ antiporter
VGLAAARRDAEEIALGTVFGGAIFLVCVALGLGALLYPLRVRLPRGLLESEEVREAEEKRYSYPKAAGLTVLGLVVIAVGGELVTEGAGGIVASECKRSPMVEGQGESPQRLLTPRRSYHHHHAHDADRGS